MVYKSNTVQPVLTTFSINMNENKRLRCPKIGVTWYLCVLTMVYHSLVCKGLCQVEKIQKSEKNSEVGGWVKPKLRIFFFLEGGEMLCFSCLSWGFSLFYMFPKNIKLDRVSFQSEFFSDFWIFLT